MDKGPTWATLRNNMYPKMQYWVHLSANMYPKWCFWILNYFLRLDNIRGPADRKLEFQTP